MRYIMKTITLNKADYLAKVKTIAEARALRHAIEWGVPSSRAQEFVKCDIDSMVTNATPKRGEWSIIDDDGKIYETPRNYKPYAPLY